MAEATSTSKQANSSHATSGGGNAVYVLGLIGALVFFWQQAASFWEYVLALGKALVWPALLVYEAFHVLTG